MDEVVEQDGKGLAWQVEKERRKARRAMGRHGPCFGRCKSASTVTFAQEQIGMMMVLHDADQCPVGAYVATHERRDVLRV